MNPQSAFEQIVKEHGSMIRRIAASYEANPHLAEELAQEILAAIWSALPKFRGDSSLRTFIARIATNRAVTHVTRALKLPQSVELSEELPASDENPETQATAREQGHRLVIAVRSLPLALRQAALLTLEGFTSAEIANVLGVTPNAVSLRISRAKELLRSLMGEQP